MPSPPSSIKQLWFRWKALRLPWRKKWLCGFDLSGNTFWEFKDSLNSNRYRRIVKYSRHTHYGDVKVPPVWMQWLRHTRQEAPTIAEQEYDLARQRQMKLLAAAADERWASKPSALDAPDKQQPVNPLDVDGARHYIPQAQQERMASDGGDMATGAAGAEDTGLGRGREVKKENPWKVQQQGNPGDDWQPAPWTPSPARRRA